MAVQAEGADDFDFPSGYAECIAQASNSWAYLEYYINCAIWELAGTPPALGACLTSQIINLNARLNALLALMKRRSMSEKIIKRVNKFAENARAPGEFRNRIIHDMWFLVDGLPNSMGQLKVTAAKKLEFDLREIPLCDVEDSVRAIVLCRIEASKIRLEIEAQLLTLPKIPHEELYPIAENRRGR